MADGNNQLVINDGDDDDIFVYTGGRAPRDVRRAKIDESIDTAPASAFFSHCQQLTEVEGHDRLMIIEHLAFYCCPRLRRLAKMGGVIEIECNAFKSCTALSDLDFDKLEIIGNGAFSSCLSLKSVSLPSIRRVGESAFYNCSGLMEAIFGEDLERIGRHAFHFCTSLRRIVIPLKDDLIVGEYAFHRCDNLSRVDTLVGGIHKTISSLHLESWRDEMKEEIDRINQTLPDTRSEAKAVAVRQWIRFVIRRMEHYKTEHRLLVKEATTLLELALWKANLDENGVDLEGVRVTRGQRQIKRAKKERCITSGAGIIIKNVLPFLELDE